MDIHENFKKRLIHKPWGQEIIWGETGDYVGKVICINRGHRLSRQYHKVKEETIMVIRGTLLLEVGTGDEIESFDLKRGDNFHVTPGLVHRFCAPYGDVEIVEVSTPHLDDVVRIEDDYRREE